MICGECLGALENGGVAVMDIESGGGGLRHSATGKIVGGGGARRNSHSGNGGGFDHVQPAIKDKARCFVVGIGEAVERDAQAHAAAAQWCILGHGKGALHRGGKVERANHFENAVVIPVEIQEGSGAGCGQAIEFGLECDWRRSEAASRELEGDFADFAQPFWRERKDKDNSQAKPRNRGARAKWCGKFG